MKISDVCFKRDGVFAMELGGPEVGRGCGGRGIIHGFELPKSSASTSGLRLCAARLPRRCRNAEVSRLPIARDMCQKVIVVGSNDLQSLYVANNLCSAAVEYFRKLGGNVGVAGMIVNKDDGTGEAHAFAAAAGIPVLAAIPANESIRTKAPITKSSAFRAANGDLSSRNSPRMRQPLHPCDRQPLTQRRPPRLFKSEVVAAASCSSRRVSKTCVVGLWSIGRRSKSSRHRLTRWRTRMSSIPPKDASSIFDPGRESRRACCHAGKDEMRLGLRKRR